MKDIYWVKKIWGWGSPETTMAPFWGLLGRAFFRKMVGFWQQML